MTVQISRILHAGYLFRQQDCQIVFDPIFENPFSRNCYAFPDVQFHSDKIRDLKLDAIFISHHHDDHCSLESLHLLNRNTPIYLYCLHEEMFSLIQEMGFLEVNRLRLNQSVQIMGFKVTVIKALDFEVDCLFQIQVAGMNILNVVDSWIDDQTLQELTAFSWDLILWPFQRMRELEVLSPSRADMGTNEIPIEWVQQLQKLKPRFLVPSSCQFRFESWSWKNSQFFPISYDSFRKEVKRVLPQVEIQRMNPSTSFELTDQAMRPQPPLDWILPVGPQDVDYEFHPSIQPPTTAQIAQKFSPLAPSEKQSIYHYCQHTLPQKYNSMADYADDYFKKCRHWKLSIFDHIGNAKNFYYRLQNFQIYTCEKVEPESLSWVTEIPLFNFFGALFEGETLSSMYIRINDCVFSDEIENELQGVEWMEDPLIRCLYNLDFGSYQRRQLRKIQLSSSP